MAGDERAREVAALRARWEAFIAGLSAEERGDLARGCSDPDTPWNTNRGTMPPFR